ncbi:MAG: hypothetical protein WBA97_10095 [Actinophytocola sp.]|uniref:hypothetical protein n=1 Tax=Actinophytocola sp. TaxID=1872138 RepID=UPI003C7831EB
MSPDRGRVSRIGRTGLALVHEGEWVVAGAGSAAEADEAVDEERTVIQYHFPVEIEVVGTAAEVDRDTVVDLTLGRLAEHLEGLV